MVGTLEVVIIASAGALGFLLISVFSVFLALRARDKRLTKAQPERQLAPGQRTDLHHSNYSYVPQPSAKLRRSAHLPYGVVSESWAAIPSRESFDPPLRSHSEPQPDEAGPKISPKRARSFRASFSAHSFSIPKSRRQKRIEKAVPLRALPYSPLSAITEKSGINTTNASPSVGIAELPTEVSPRTTPDRDAKLRACARPSSLQWPLPPSNGRTCATMPTSVPAPVYHHPTLRRMGSVGHNIAPPRKSFAPRSFSASSTLSTAPEDPLPPLPSIAPVQWGTGPRPRLRLSAVSIDTIGSSLLGEGRASPSRPISNLPSPVFDPISPGLPHLRRRGSSQDNAAGMVTGAAKLRSRTDCTINVSRRGPVSGSKINHVRTIHDDSSRPQQCLVSPLTESSIASMNLNGSRASLMSQRISRSSMVSSSIPNDIIRTSAGCKQGTAAIRHSMYEQRSIDGRTLSASANGGDESGSAADSLHFYAVSRPASVATDSLHQWESGLIRGEGSPAAKARLASPPRGSRKPYPTHSSAKGTGCDIQEDLARSIEDAAHRTDSVLAQSNGIPGLDLIERERKLVGASHEPEQKTSILETRPILKATSAGRVERARDHSNTTESSSNHDLDVFRNPRYDPNAPNIFQHSQEAGQSWPLRPPLREQAQLQATPPRLQAIREPYDPDSPTLPPPVLSSATIFSQPLPPGTRTSAIQGPRRIPGSDRASRFGPSSPTTAKPAAKREDLRRSVMRPKIVPSDAKGQTRLSQIFRGMDGETMSHLLHESHSDREDQNDAADQPGVSVVNLSLVDNNNNHHHRHHQSRPKPDQDYMRRTSRSPSTSPSRSHHLAPVGLHLSKSIRSNMTMARSLSGTSVGATSIWEDASVRDSSPEPDLPPASRFLVPSPQSKNQQNQQPPSQYLAAVPGDEERKTTNENCDTATRDGVQNEDGKAKQQPQWDAPYITHKARDRDRDRDRESKLTSPQGRGLGLFGVGVPSHIGQQYHHNAHWKTRVRGAGTTGLYDVDGFLLE